MRIPPIILLLGLAACADTGSSRLTDEGGGTRPQLTAGTCAFSVTQLSSNPLSASANSSGNSNASWQLLRSNSVGVTIIGQSFSYSGQVTGASNSNWVAFPYTMPTPPQMIDADLLYSTGSAGTGSVGLSLQYVCANGGDTLTKTFRQMGLYTVNVN